MDSFRVFSFYLCFWTVCTAKTEDVVIRRLNETCGTVTIKGPSVSGRDIKVEFLPTPIKPGFFASIFCQKPGRQIINMTTNGTIYTYTLKGSSYDNVGDCLVRYSANIKYYCDTRMLTLEGCGLLYMYKRDPIVVGDTVELRYMPGDAILKQPNSYIRKWILRPLNGNQTQDIKIDNSTITEEQADFNEIVLRLRNITMAMSGGISLQCTGNRSENQTTGEINIQVIDSSTSAASNDGHGALIGAVVPVLAVAVNMIVIACVYRKIKKQRHVQNAVNVALTDDDPTHPDTNNDVPEDAGVIVRCSSANKENEYVNVIPKSQRPQREQEETIPTAAENDFELAVVNNEGNGSEESTKTESDYTKLKFDLLTPGAIYTSLKHD